MSPPSEAALFRPLRVLRPIRAVACPRDVELVPAARRLVFEEFEQGERPHREFWVRCAYPGGGMGYAELRARTEGLR